jgi:hypothetical protein
MRQGVVPHGGGLQVGLHLIPLQNDLFDVVEGVTLPAIFFLLLPQLFLQLVEFPLMEGVLREQVDPDLNFLLEVFYQ